MTMMSDTWTGDFDDLAPHADELCDDPALCDRLFATKSEAFLAGLYVAGGHAVPAQADGDCRNP